MTCNFCGSSLDDNETECPYCGHKVGNSPKALAADMAAKFAAKTKNVSGAAKKQHKQMQQRAKGAGSSISGAVSNVTANPKMILAIILAVFFIFLMITMFTVAALKNQVAELHQDMLSQFYQIQSTNSMLSSQIDGLGTSVGSVSTAIAEQTVSRNITITKQPTECATYIGRTGNIPIFTVEAKGSDLAFTWQKLDPASGNWVTLVWDEESNNTTYGIHLYNNVGNDQGHSEIAASNVTSAAFGSYRCVISDSYGEKATETVILSERPAD